MMKNLIKTVLFSALMFIGAGTLSAQSLSQNQSTPEVVAKKATESLSKTLGLNGDQQRSVFRALVLKENNYTKNIYGKDMKDAAVNAAKKKFDKQLEDSIKKVLTEKQYATWLTLRNQ